MMKDRGSGKRSIELLQYKSATQQKLNSSNNAGPIKKYEHPNLKNVLDWLKRKECIIKSNCF